MILRMIKCYNQRMGFNYETGTIDVFKHIEAITVIFYCTDALNLSISPEDEDIISLIQDGEIEQDCINFNYKNMIMINCN